MQDKEVILGEANFAEKVPKQQIVDAVLVTCQAVRQRFPSLNEIIDHISQDLATLNSNPNGQERDRASLSSIIQKLSTVFDIYITHGIKSGSANIWLDQNYSRSSDITHQAMLPGTPQLFSELNTLNAHVHLGLTQELETKFNELMQSFGTGERTVFISEDDSDEKISAMIASGNNHFKLVLFPVANSGSSLLGQLRIAKEISKMSGARGLVLLRLTDGVRMMVAKVDFSPPQGEISPDGYRLYYGKHVTPFDTIQGGLPPYELCSLLLNTGIPLLYPDNTTDSGKTEANRVGSEESKMEALWFSPVDKDKQTIRNKLRAFLTKEPERTKSDISHHYANFAESVEKKKPNLVLPTRSGVSAIRLAISLAVKEVGEDEVPATYIQDGFYYEPNIFLLHTVKEVSDPELATILMINHQTSSPLGLAEGYEELRVDSIRRFMDRVNANPQKHFSVIYDATLDPTTSILGLLNSTHDNLSVIKVCSLTKHQGGQSQSTAGMVWAWGANKSTQDNLSGDIHTAMAGLLPYNVATFPLRTPRQVRHQVERMSSLIKELADYLALLQKDIPAPYRWSLSVTNFYAFLMPPTSTLLDHYCSANDINRSVLRDVENYELLNEIKSKLMPMIDLGECMKTDNKIVFADSFGMLDNRLCSFTNRGLFRETIYRISPGIKNDEASEQELRKLLRTVIAEYQVKLRDFLAP